MKIRSALPARALTAPALAASLHYMSLRRGFYQLLFAPSSPGQRVVSVLLAVLIVANVIATMLATLPELDPSQLRALMWFERVSIGIFLVEYLLRAWSCVEDPRHAVRWGRVRYLLTPMALIDLLAMVPTLLPELGVDLRSLRVLRLLRMLTILRLGRYSTGMQLMGRVVWTRRGELGALLLIVVVLLLCAATIMYFLEHDAQPRIFASIPHSLWWAIVTLTTVGYGDAVPVTLAGKLVGGLVALLGVGVVAMPAGILASGLNDELARLREVKNRSSQEPH